MTFLIIMCIFYTIMGFVDIRLRKIKDFQMFIIEKCAEYDVRRIRELKQTSPELIDTQEKTLNWLDKNTALDWYYKKVPGTLRLLFSRKKLNLSCWMPEELNQKLLNT